MTHEALEPEQAVATVSAPLFSIVAIGASAGGLAALKQLFAQVPEDSDLAYVIVVHLSPEHESHLDTLLQPHIKMPVVQVRETLQLEKNCVYVIPPNANLDTIDTHLRLSELEIKRQERAPIDHFFRTLADTHDGHAIGVVLTGTGSDGTLGLRRIKERGGLTIVQDPSEAEYDGMPRSAIAGAPVDLVLPLAAIAPAILRFAHTEPGITVPREGEDPDRDTRQMLQKVFAQIRARTGRDFSYYKNSTLLRRITRRMQFNHVQDPSEYIDLLRKQADEVQALADDLLITVTSFFRDPGVFEVLERDVVPQIFAGKTADETVRVWSVGCATGEEAYSLAMLLLEEASRHDAPPSIQIFASDLHLRSLEKAREGFYAGDIETDVNPERIKRFFQKENGGYRVRKEVRELVIFAPHNILADPPFSRLDLISCRNLLIYLQRELQRQVAELFHYALDQDGFLVLGVSENVDAAELFRIEDRKRGIYRKRNVQAFEPRLPVFPLTRGKFTEGRLRNEVVQDPIAFGLLHQKLLEQHGPPSVLVSPDDNVVHFSARASRYLVHPGGVPTTSAYKLVREELRLELRTTLPAARAQKRLVRSKPVLVRFDGKSAPVVLDVCPAFEPEQEGFMLLMFDERPSADTEVENASANGTQEPDARQLARLGELEAEKRQAEQRLQAIIEEYETSQEEIRASNEELQSANEELRSTLEELETSKEELQSMNEELQTVNQENRHKVDELSQLSDDLQNLLGATEIATLFLDRELRILRFTPKVAELFSVRISDRGRPISNFTNRLGYDMLEKDTQEVLRRLVPIEREVRDETGRWYLTRVLPYRSEGDRIAGVVVTFVDITHLKGAEEALRSAKEYSEYIIEALPEPLLVLSCERLVLSANAAFCKHFEIAPDQARGRNIYELGNGEWNTPALRGLLEESLPKAKVISGFKFDHTFGILGPRVMLLNARQIDSMQCVLLGMRDITEQCKAEQALARDIVERQSAEEQLLQASHHKDEFLAMLGHELRNPLAAIRSATELMKLSDLQEPKVRDVYGVMERQTAHMVAIIDGLLDVSRIARGKINLNLEALDLTELLVRVLADLELRLRDGGLELRRQLFQGPLWVRGDEVRLVQVFNNVLGNAVKFTEGPGVVTVVLERTSETARVRVCDTGVGVRPEMLARIFEAFQQENQGPARSAGGLGLGLALAKGLLELHGGSIEARSDGLGKGAEFAIELPLIDPPELQIVGAPETVPQPNRVLIVEDNSDAAEMLQGVLELCGHRVRVASNAKDALNELRRDKPDIVLCDLGLPGMSGHDLARAVRADPELAGVPLVALSGYGQPEDRRRTTEAGFDDHLVKPVSLKDLNSVIRRCGVAAASSV